MNVRAAGAGARAAGRRRRRPAAPARGARRRASWRSWANVSSWPIDLTSRSGSTGRSSRPVARSRRCRPWARPSAADARPPVERGEVADRRHAHPPQPLERGRADAPQPLDRQRVEVGQLLARPDLERRPARADALGRRPAAWRRPTPAWRGTCSGATPTEHVRPSCSADRRRADRRAIVTPSPSRARAPGDVEERLVEGQRLDERRDGGEDGVDLAAGRGVGGVVAGQEHRRRAQPPGRRRRQRRVHAVAAGLVGRRGDDAAPARCRRRRPAGRAARAAGAARRRRRRRPCRRGGSCAPQATSLTVLPIGGDVGVRSAGQAAAGAAAAAVGDPQASDEAERLADDALGQLRLAGPAVAERDRELDDACRRRARGGGSSRSGSRSPRP